ncbi:hypothetical protein WJX72_012008 [[Myrmecia] bisecta]|uniref:Uncharacterized protein n=1 Tax=[Myrmecia] bisecta TaxID=41462 RepID=A0AAW1PRG9_9CHLO
MLLEASAAHSSAGCQPVKPSKAAPRGRSCLRPPCSHYSPCLAYRQRRVRSTSRIRCRIVCLGQAPSRNIIDPTLVWGDCMMLLSTELASDRVPKDQMGLLSGVLVAAWVGVAVAVTKGDYRYKYSEPSMIYFNSPYATAMLIAMFTAATTWALFVPTALAAYASMVVHHLLDVDVIRQPASSPYALPPELEVVMAVLWTVSSWRGIYAAYRLML